ncbi:MAG: HAD family hydrolase [Lachnospiraceae bacterium]|nr:HAD family hydrolase [Lachnospiraceae bacterium]
MTECSYDGIIFDVDGTLWDSTFVVEKAWNKALKDNGYSDVSVTADRLKGLFGLPMLEIIEDILPESTLEERKEFLPNCSKYEFEFLEKEAGRVYEGLEECLRTLKEEGHSLYIVSNCQKGYIELFFEKTGLGHYFDKGICPGDTGMLKAENIALIVDRFGLNRPLYVGDTHMDAEACIKAKVPFCFASYGFGSVNDYAHIISKPLDLIEICR